MTLAMAAHSSSHNASHLGCLRPHNAGRRLRMHRRAVPEEHVLQNIGWPELVVVLLILLVVFGAGRLPQIGEGIGKAIRNLKRGLKTDDDIEVTPKEKRVAKRSSAKKVADVEEEE